MQSCWAKNARRMNVGPKASLEILQFCRWRVEAKVLKRGVPQSRFASAKSNKLPSWISIDLLPLLGDSRKNLRDL